MHLLENIIPVLLTASLLFAPAFAQTNAQTTPSSQATSTSSGSGSSGLGLGLAVGAGALGISLLSSASSLFTPKLISFGGRVTTIVPCTLGVVPMLHVTIISTRGGVPHPEFYIWTPATITKLAGPPNHPGQQALGLADIPLTCFVGGGLFSLPVPFIGLRMTTVGTSPL